MLPAVMRMLLSRPWSTLELPVAVSTSAKLLKSRLDGGARFEVVSVSSSDLNAVVTRK